MNTVTKYFSIFIFLYGLSLTETKGQTSDRSFADSLFAAGAYLDASIAYERYIYYHSGTSDHSDVKYRKALCYRFVGDYDQAIRELDGISILRTEGAPLNKVLYERSFNYFLSGKDHEAQLNISRIPAESLSPEEKLEFWPLYILINNRLREFDASKIMLLELVELCEANEEQKLSMRRQVDSLYSAKVLPKAFSSEKAKNLSQFIPGAGQAYAGHPGEGAVSFLLNAALLGFGIHQLYFRYYFTAYIAAFTVFNKTYFGGMKRAEFLALTETSNQMTTFNQQVIVLLRENVVAGK